MDFAQDVIAKARSAQTPEDLDGLAWKAHDLLARRHGDLSPDQAGELRSALLEALMRNPDPEFVSPIFWALGGAGDHSLIRTSVRPKRTSGSAGF
jgi:cobalamin biosynthesis protein CobD/CbiB